MKSLSLFRVAVAFAVSVVILIAQNLLAYERQDALDAVENLNMQVKKLSAQSSAQCPMDYKKLFANDTVHISIYYGYEDFENTTADLLNAKIMAYMLTRKCVAGVEACGFKQTKNAKFSAELRKTINGKLFVVSIFSTSLTEYDSENLNPDTLYWQQDQHSKEVKSRFYQDLTNADIVIYSGHSRLGAGLGFDGQSWIQEAVNAVFRFPLKPILGALSKRPTKLKALALLSCESEKYYRADIESANPGLSLILSNAEIQDDESEQIELGLLNSYLSQKCIREFKQSMVPATYPSHKVMEYIVKAR